ncbi:filamentous haemagglutinin family protein [Acidovorax cavernicola]|uniref:Filamentous hemagglutinin N-terminal domain-containing protein n=1 Tax=Acidovorax cavernicola TaxID=1675792 RepID=A0A9X8D4M7_9BURK|nr:filamentous haemagglutinin family protein [Acidovorax cavernicola]RIX79069.1 filamentous hemagglutinin N-terminal domain-containing protein [Acidovorax cavernicola]
MSTRGPLTPIHATKARNRRQARRFRMAPIARAIAMTLAANGALVLDAQAQQAFSGAWFASKNAVQNTAAATGRLPNGMPASMLTNPLEQRKAGEQLQRSLSNLNTAARSIAAQQAAQAAAREAASNGGSDIPDGLADGGLKVDTNSLTAGWLNARAPVQTAAGGRTVVGIEQTAEKAILNWESFNVGKHTTVQFDQKGGAKPDGTNAWIALNRINDPSGRPSQIAGQIKADGSVYLINRNGIVFTGSSQVDTRSLVASSLSLSDKQFKLGINNPQVLANQGNDFPIPQFGEFTSARPEIYGDNGFKPGVGGAPDRMGNVDRFDPGAAPGEVRVDAGAQLAATSGGKVMLFAPKVRNAGRISAPDGQVILAAGENIYLKTPSAQDPNAPRGLDVAASAVPGWAFTGGQVWGALKLSPVYADASFVNGLRDVVMPEMAARAKAIGYEVVNTGTVQADRGNITLQAQDVRQSGVLSATTALNNRNGSILLRAWGLGSHMYADGVNDLINWSAGTLTLGEGSISQVLPDASDTSEIEAAALATRYQPGRVSLYGQLIDIRSKAGVLVPAGTVHVESAVNPMFTQFPYFKPGSLRDASRIYLDSEAFLSVAGLQGMQVDMSRNFIEAELRINELRDSPMLLDSWVRGKKVIVDRRVSGVFKDGPMAGVQWVLGPDGATYIPGAWVGTPLGDVSGWVGVGKTDLRELSANAGSIALRAGGAVITRTGSMLDVSGGSVRYADGMNTATKLMGADGRVHTMDRALSDTDYTGIAGEFTRQHARWGVKTTWRTPLIGADYKEAGYTEGRKAGGVQIHAGDAMVLEGDMLGGVVVGERQSQKPGGNKGGRLELGENSPDGRPWSPGTIVVSHDPKRLAQDFDAKTKLGDDFYLQLKPGELKSRKLTFLSDDMLSNSGMGTIVLNHINGDFELASGAVLNLSPGASLSVAGTEGSTNDIRIHGQIRAPGGQIGLSSANGKLEVGEHGRLDASGQWINTWRDGALRGAWAIDGGAITVNVGKISAHKEAVFDVSGGGRVDSGKQGLPTLRVGDAGAISLTGVTPDLDLGALNLRAHAAGSAGSLSIQAASTVQVGGMAASPQADDAAATAVVLPATLFGERGFGKVTVSVRGEGHGIVVPEGVAVSPQAASLVLNNFAWRDLPSGRNLADAAPLGVLRPDERATRAPATLSLGTENGPIRVARGASVRTDTGGSLSLNAGGEQGALTVAGRLDAPAGRIALSGTTAALEAGGELLARGVPRIHVDSSGRRVGEVRDGGTVSIQAGELRLEKDALIDVSGATGTIDGVADAGPSGTRMPRPAQAITLDSNGGLIEIKGKGLIESTMLGKAGGPNGIGGRILLNMTATSGPNGSPLEQLQRVLPDPDCYGFMVDGACSDWKQGLDFDWAPGLRSYGYEIDGPMILPSSLLAHLADVKELVVSDRLGLPGAAGALDPAQFGLTPQALDMFRDALLSGDLLRDVLQKPGQPSALTVRPQAFRDGGFADLSLVNATQGAIRLDDANLALGRSISLQGAIVGHAGSSSSLRAPRIVLTAVPGASPAPLASSASPAGAGQLTVAGSLIDISASEDPTQFQAGAVRIGGFGRTVLEAGEIRMGGALPSPINEETRLQVNLDVDGQLVLNAGQVYPTTAMTGVIRAGDSITVERLGDAGSAPLSAGGSLRLEAPVIAQNGVLRAPFGQIELNAGERLSLGAGSLTSVSGAGLTVPFGTLSNNEHWHDPSKGVDPVNPSSGSLVAPPEKRITMKSPDVALARGAVVDIAGGGDLHASEFVPGPGGSHDVLNMPGMYAILPGQAGVAPAGGAAAGQRVWLAGGPGLAAGWYTLLPARYALLPGAFAVQATGKAWGGALAPATRAPDGSLVMQGKAGNTYGGNQDVQASAWRVMSGATVRRYSEYHEATANDFFSSEAFKLTQYRLTGQDVVTPRLPRDGGAVVFDAGRRLVLDGTLRSAPDAGGRGGLVDIAGKKIAIVGGGQDSASLQADGYLVIDSASLSNFGAGSLLVGGKRKGNALGLELDVTATDIVVRNNEGSELFGPEIILAASDHVAIEAGSRVSAKGRSSRGAGSLVMKPRAAAVYADPDGNLDDNNDGVIDAKDAVDDVLVSAARDWGALMRVSTGDAVKVIRQGVDTSRGGLVAVGAGAVVNGDAALLIDATRTTELAASAQIAGTDLSVAAGRIGFGGGTEGMVLDSGALAQLGHSTRLTLRSYTDFDFYSSLDLGAAGLKSLTFDGAAFVGRGAGDVTIKGERIALVNSGGGSSVPAGTGAGGFTLDAATLVLGAGQKRFSGFGAVTLSGRDAIVGEGAGGIDTGASPLALHTPLLTGRGGAVQSMATGGALQVVASAEGGTSSFDPQDSLGLRMSLTGRSIAFGGRAVARGGSIDMTATGGSLVVSEGATLDVGGSARQFFDVAEYADAGRIGLSAVGGDVRLNAGSRLNLAAHPKGGDAGTLSLAASQGGTVVLDGTIAAQAGSHGGRAGSFALDIEALPDFAGFSQRLNDAGFNRSRQFRIRQGDVVLGGLTTVEDFGLTADRGSIDIAGTVDARSGYGGAIRITAGNGVAMRQGAQLMAGATGELGTGRVTLEAAGGQLNLMGGLIDVTGNEGGKVRLRAQQNAAHDDLAVAALNVAVTGARSAVLEGVSVYDVKDYDGATVDSVKADAIADAARFRAASAAVATRLGTGLAVMPGIEVRSAGDLALNGDWNLWRDFSGAREGTLTLRAGGNLAINGHLSDGFDAADRSGRLQTGPSWNLRLVAGGELASADAMALRPLAAQAAGKGSITVGAANTAVPTDSDPIPDNGAGKLVRTGTGDLDVRAGRDLRLAHKESVIYTAGRKDTTAWSDFSTANPHASYGVEGGNLAIGAQGSIEATPAGQRFTEWLNRQGNLNAERFFGEYTNGEYGMSPDGVYGPVIHAPEQSSWWIDYGRFQQGVGALGGGNVSVDAGGDLRNLLVALPTHMRMRGGRSASEAMTMEMRNGGAMTVQAGGAIRGGQYYVARGAGDIRAGETAVGHTVTLTREDTAGGFTKTSYTVAPLLALGDATLSLRTAGDLRLQTVVDPLLVTYGEGLRNDGQVLNYGAYMSGYTDRSALRLVSTGGNITFVNRAEYIFRDLQLRWAEQETLVGFGGNRYPARFSAAALNGGIAIDGPLYVLPGTTNDVKVVAKNDIRFDAPLVMAYATPAMMSSGFMPGGAGSPFSQMNMEDLLDNLINPALASPVNDAYLRSVHNPDVLPLANDLEPSRIYASQGSIVGLDVKANEQTWVRAGTDIRGLRLAGRNLRASDVTLLEAGNDILAMKSVARLDPNSEFSAGLTGIIELQGPGTLVLAAGRDLYADNLQVQTLGNQRYDRNNRALPETQVKGLPEHGATITAMAGLNHAVGYEAFTAAYLDPSKVASMPDHLKTRGADGSVLPIYLVDQVETRAGGQEKTVRRGLVSYMSDMTGEKLEPLDAWARFQKLPSLAQQQFLRQVYLLELREAGRDQNEPGTGGLPRNGGYNRGYAAIETLFPGDTWKGDVAANKLMLRTMAGGDIDVLTPGGGLQVAALGAAVPAGYGLVTLASGHIGIAARDDVTVNQSRILSFVPEVTKQGSDQIIWATVGDIDAGRGSKTLRVPSAPEVSTDLDGVTVIREKSDMSGSGIGTVGDGDVDLVAPGGTVNAGDAGLRVAGNLNIAALQVLNADNIQVKGETKGLPVIASVNIGALTNASAAAAQATAAAQDVVQRERTAARQALPSVFTVRVLGFGNEPAQGGGGGAPQTRSGPASGAQAAYDPMNPVQVVGMGRKIDPRHWAALSSDERRRLQQDR